MSKFTIEAMIRAQSNHYACRIWRADGVYNLPNASLKEKALETLLHLEAHPITISNVVTKIANQEGVSAVEIIELATGDGICIYKDWP